MVDNNETPRSEEALLDETGKAYLKAKATQEAKNALLVAQKQGAQLERELAAAGTTANLPTPLGGSATLNNTAQIARLVTHHALRHEAEKAGARIDHQLSAGQTDRSRHAHLLIVDTLHLLEEQTALTAVQSQLASATRSVEKQLNENTARCQALPLAQTAASEHPEPDKAALSLLGAVGIGETLGTAAAMISALSNAAGAAASVASWFRREKTVDGLDLTVESTTAKLLLAHSIQHHKVSLAGFGLVKHSSLLQALTTLLEKLHELIDSAAQLSAQASSLPAGEQKTTLESALTASQLLLETVGKLIDGLTAAPPSGTVPALRRALTAEQMLDPSYTHFLYVQVEAAGGQSITDKSLWRSAQISYVGGGVLSYVLAETHGAIVAADVLPVFSTLTNAEEPRIQNVVLPEIN
ncbi:MAG: hypothetical protein NTV69_05905 [Caldilinea sp.]|nr:hypothetical protein [Caldilinea sp.]